MENEAILLCFVFSLWDSQVLNQILAHGLEKLTHAFGYVFGVDRCR